MMNLPNKLTMSRIFLVPVFMLFVIPLPDWVLNASYLSFARDNLMVLNDFIKNMGNYVAAIIFIIAASTDGVDGYIARKKKLVTKFGKFLDPIADKLLVTAALISLVQTNEVTAWAAMCIIAREFAVTGLRLVAAGEGVVIEASNWGKIKTVTQMIAIVIALLKNFPFNYYANFPFDRISMTIAVIVTIYSGYDYIVKNIKIIDYK